MYVWLRPLEGDQWQLRLGDDAQPEQFTCAGGLFTAMDIVSAALRGDRGLSESSHVWERIGSGYRTQI